MPLPDYFGFYLRLVATQVDMMGSRSTEMLFLVLSFLGRGYDFGADCGRALHAQVSLPCS
jgi:hypothetical protein